MDVWFRIVCQLRKHNSAKYGSYKKPLPYLRVEANLNKNKNWRKNYFLYFHIKPFACGCCCFKQRVILARDIFKIFQASYVDLYS
jgi:hypothetical protein